MKLAKLYKHVNNTDVAFKPEKMWPTDEKDIVRIEGMWYNIVNSENVFVIDYDQIYVNKKDFKNWREYK